MLFLGIYDKLIDELKIRKSLGFVQFLKKAKTKAW